MIRTESSDRFEERRVDSLAIRAQSVSAAVAHLVWSVGRLPLLALLTLLEPLVRSLFSLAMVLGILAATVFELSAAGARFEFLAMCAGSLGCGFALLPYYGLLSLLSRQ